MTTDLNKKIINIAVGDLILQNIVNPLDHRKSFLRKGLILKVGDRTCTIRWMDQNLEHKEDQELRIYKITLRKMIMDGIYRHCGAEDE